MDKKIHKIWRRAVSILMTFFLTAGLALSNLSVAYADVTTELPGEDTSEKTGTACSSTAFGWIRAAGASEPGSSTGRFDICGLKAGQTEYSGQGIMTSYGFRGYPTYIQVGSGSRYKVDLPNNGAVVTYDNVELRIVLSPSPDNKYIFVDYYLYNRDDTPKTVKLGSGADIMIGNDDGATLYRNSNGLHMVNRNDQSAYDCITYDTDLGITGTDNIWMGAWSSGGWTNHIFDDNTDPSCTVSDTAMAYSWNIPLRQYEQVHKRVAFSMKDTTYYVSPNGDNGHDGTYQRPFKTIQHALDELAGKKGYIFLMDNYNISGPLTISGNQTDITFGSTDYLPDPESAGDYLPSKEIMTLTRAATSTSPLFQVSGTATLRFQDITLNGGGTATANPLVSAASGMLDIGSGTTITNCKGNDASLGSAVNVTGGATLSMNLSEVTGNSGGKGAIYFDGNEFHAKNTVTVQNNTNQANVAANVYLNTGKHITVDGDLGSSKIGVTTAALPKASAEGAATAANQEVTVAVPNTTYKIDPPCPFVDNFTADQKDASSVYIYQGRTVLDEEGNSDGNDKNAVLRRNGMQLSCGLIDKSGLSIPAPEYGPFTFGPGESVDLDPPPPPAGYTLDSVTIEQGEGNGLSVDGTPGTEEYGKIKGTMPNQDVVVTYSYKMGEAKIVFNTNGGTPQPDPLTGTVGDPVPGLLPSVTKYGYNFLGWNTDNNWDWEHSQQVTSLPSNFEAAGETNYYAIFSPDENQTFDATVNHTNMSGTISFGDPKTLNGMVETPITDTKRNVKGYTWSKDDSSTAPATYNFSGQSVPVGTFDGTGNYTGKMPGQDTTVSYRYKVDTTQPKLILKVNYESTDNPAVSLLTSKTEQLYPEDSISLTPEAIYGYKCVGVNIISGAAEGDSGNGYVYPFKFDEQTPPSEENHFAVNSLMPNQPVELTYRYEATIPGYEMTVKYEDSSALDDSLRNIIDPVRTSPHKAGTHVGGDYETPYGYQEPYAVIVKPDGAEITVDPSTHDWSGTMPNDNAQVTYKHHRDNTKWVTVTYKPGNQNLGTLQRDGAPLDLQGADGGDFTAKILKNDGGHDGYTLAQIADKKLMPKAVLDTGKDKYYQFDGWCLEGTDTVLPPDYQFTQDTTVTAHYGEKEGAWVTVNFAAGPRATNADTQPTSYHTTYDKTWANIPEDSLPEYTWQTNYLDDGWWVNGARLDPDALLVDGATYTAQCRPDPDIFGTDVTMPNAAPRLNTQGKGRITVYGIIEGYQYILVDAQGKVQAVEKGKLLSDRVEFDGLYPGAHYTVYEALGSIQVQVGQLFDSSLEGVSPGAPVLTPVLDTNYRIRYDNDSEGKTVLHIEPADRQSDYALLDSQGHVVHTPQTDGSGWQRPSGNPGKMDFTGLDYNAEYTVVARPTGQTEIQAESLREDGSVITTDPGGELELTNYIIQTPHGSIVSVAGEPIGEDSFDTAHKGDQVEIQAEPSDGDGTFSHWEFTIGSVDGLAREVETRELTFTMPDSNLVLTAIYDYPPSTGSPSNAKVTDEVRGGSREELSLDPDEIADLEDQLTTTEDETLMDVNKADVSYRVVYRKNAVKATESNAIKALEPYSSHQDAFKGAWGLDVSVERYVNGRKVGVASPADASFNTYVQLGKDDVDMMEYNLYQVIENPGGHGVSYSPVTLNDDPEETGGLFTFTAEAGGRYVMVYNRAYRMYFLNEAVLPGLQDTTRYWFKVRRKETPTEDQLAGREPVAETEHFTGPDGVEYDYAGWSYLPDKWREFDPTKEVTRKTYVYAYYGNNAGEVNDARKQLEDAVKAAISLSDDHFLKVEESEKLKQFIARAQAVLDNPQATIAELTDAITELEERVTPYREILDDRYDHYDDIQSNSHSGGSHGGGGGGAGTKQNPYNDISPNSYQIGTNGSWVETTGPGGEKQMSFQLNGGSLLSGMWAKLEYPAGADAAGDGWYRFDSKGVMQTGWICDETGSWYYCNTEQDGYAGKMATDWKLDAGDGHWYYLDPVSGAMALGWRQIGGKWYYFSPVGGGTYTYDPVKENWTYGGASGRPMGSMYKNEVTPDGYQVGADGAWVQ